MSKAPETLTTDEAELLLLELRQAWEHTWSSWKNLRNYTMALLMLDAGLRVGEVVRLKIENLILAGEAKNAIELDSGLAEKSCVRTIPTSERIRAALNNLNVMTWNIPNVVPLDWAFFDRDVKLALSIRQVQRIIAKASQKAFGRKIHPHVLRHTFATRLMRITSTPVVQQLLGHKRLTSTQVYVHPNGDDCKAAIDALNKPPAAAI